MLNKAKASTAALLEAADVLLKREKYSESEGYILEVLRRDIKDAKALAALAELNLSQKKIKEAITFYMAAIQADPATLLYKERFIELGGEHRVAIYEDLTDTAITECLKTSHLLDCTKLQGLWFSHLLSCPDFERAFGLSQLRVFDAENKPRFKQFSDFKPLFTARFLLGIKNMTINHPIFEEFIVSIRTHLLEDQKADAKKFTRQESLLLSEALSHYAFQTDYILAMTPDEKKTIEALRHKIESTRDMPFEPLEVSIFSCYMPLYTLSNAERIAEQRDLFPEIASIIDTQILEYNSLKKTTQMISSLTSIDAGTSSEVKEQYESFPYPRWKSISQSGILRGWSKNKRNEEIARNIRHKKGKILSAGCGTGMEAIMLATIFPNSEILAIDLSLSSLSYAIKKSTALGIKNITFKQADILHMGSTGLTFDYIVSGGVLHHMKDPMAGWKILRDLLRPDGIMTIGLYSRAARRTIIDTRIAIQSNGYTSDQDGMMAFREAAPKLLEEATLNGITRFSDYYNLSMCRDLLFHVQEHSYSLPEIKSLLAELNMKCLGFMTHSNTLENYGKIYPEDTLKNNLNNWTAFEAAHPDTFGEMYLFWCEKI